MQCVLLVLWHIFLQVLYVCVTITPAERYSITTKISFIVTLTSLSLSFFIFFHLNSSWLAYSAILVSSVEYSDSTVPYHAWCSSLQVNSLVPITYLTNPPTSLLVTISLFSTVKSLLLGLLPCLFFSPLLICFVLF